VEGLLADYPTLEFLEHPITSTKSIKTSLGNIIRVCKPLFVIDEFHKIFTEAQRAVIDSLNPRCIVGLSATPKNEMNILARVSGMDLYRDEMIKLPINVRPEANDNWRELIHDVQRKRDELESIAVKHKEQKGDYIRPIALLQAERTGRETRDNTHVHADDIREYLLQIGIPAEWIAIKSAYVDELKDEVLMSRDCQIRYIITKQALMEGWDCPFAYVLGVIPRSRQVTALTQLVGRVLRQPYTKRTGVAALDQCYTFFNYADGEELLQGIKQALEADGLEDVVDSVIGTSGPSGQHLEYRAFPIQKSIQEKYGASLFLPLWHIKDGKKIRLLSYRTDITSRINWSDLDSTDLAKSLIDTVGRRKIKGRDLQYFLGDHYQGRGSDYEKEHIEGGDEYVISQIISEHVSNPFVAFEIVKQIIAAVQKQLPRSDIEEDFGYIAHEIAKFIRTESEKREEEVFNALVEGNTVFLAISDEGGYKIPETYYAPAKYDEIEEKYIPVKSNPQCLHLAVDYITMNNLEKEIVEELKQQEGVLWWMRNKVDPSFYKIQAWRKNKIYPDFVIAKQNSEKKLELIYILESKGDQLAENLDTKYKELVFQKMTEVVSKNHLVSKQFSQYDFKLIPQSEVRSAIRGFFS
jgi:type III restriction enzyme